MIGCWDCSLHICMPLTHQTHTQPTVPHQQNSVSIKNTIATVNSDLKNKFYAKSNEINNCQTQNQLILNDSTAAAAVSGPHHSVLQSNSIQYNTINSNSNAIANNINNNSNNNNNYNINTNNTSSSFNNINIGINNTKRPLSHYSDPNTAYTPLPSTPPSSEHKGIKHFGSIKSECFDEYIQYSLPLSLISLVISFIFCILFRVFFSFFLYISTVLVYLCDWNNHFKYSGYWIHFQCNCNGAAHAQANMYVSI